MSIGAVDACVRTVFGFVDARDVDSEEWVREIAVS